MQTSLGRLYGLFQFERRGCRLPVFEFVDLEALAADRIEALGRFVPHDAVRRAERRLVENPVGLRDVVKLYRVIPRTFASGTSHDDAVAGQQFRRVGVGSRRGVEQHLLRGDVEQHAPVVGAGAQEFLAVVHRLAVVEVVAAALVQPEHGGGFGRVPAPCDRILVGGFVGQPGVDHVDHVVAAEDQFGHETRTGVVGVVLAPGLQGHGLRLPDRERITVGVGEGHGVALRQGHGGDHYGYQLRLFRTVEGCGQRHGDRLSRCRCRPVVDADRELSGDPFAAVGLYDRLADRVVALFNADVHRAEEIRELHAATLVGVEPRRGLAGENRGDGTRLRRGNDGFQRAVLTAEIGVRGPESDDRRSGVLRRAEREEKERFLRSRLDRRRIDGLRDALVCGEQSGLVVSAPGGQRCRSLVVVVFRQRQGGFRREFPGRVVVVRAARDEESRSGAEQQNPEQAEF